MELLGSCVSLVTQIHQAVFSDYSDSSDHRGAKKHRIAMVCDFFYPSLGGVEMHIWSLSQSLIRRGHKVIVITHAYGKRSGVRYMTNGLKVYYIPRQPFYNGNSLPTIYGAFPMLYDTFIRERIDIHRQPEMFDERPGRSGVLNCERHVDVQRRRVEIRRRRRRGGWRRGREGRREVRRARL